MSLNAPCKKILFVCTGNICRSPMAECVFRHKTIERGVDDRFEIDSAGTGRWHIGEPPDHRIREVAEHHGIQMTGAARQIKRTDFEDFDLILCMDEDNHEHLVKMMGPNSKLQLLLELDPESNLREVPDPYYGGQSGFETVYKIIDSACDALLDQLLAVKK